MIIAGVRIQCFRVNVLVLTSKDDKEVSEDELGSYAEFALTENKGSTIEGVPDLDRALYQHVDRMEEIPLMDYII